MVEHNRIDNTHCSCGFHSDSYRGLNSHIGNIRLNQLNDVNNIGNLPWMEANRSGQVVSGTEIREKNTIGYTRTQRQLAEQFIGVVHDICEERDILDLLEQNHSDESGLSWKLWHDTTKNSEKPYLYIIWTRHHPKYISIKIVSKITAYTKRVNLSKPDKFKIIIEESITKLAEQNEQYDATERMIQTELDKIQDIEVTRLKRHSTTWQVDISYKDKDRGIVIQYDEKTKQFLFQIRYSDKDTVFKLLGEVGDKT